MSSCDVIYSHTAEPPGGEEANSDSEPLSDKQDEFILLSPFLPRSRTFFIGGLKANQSYEFYMLCVDYKGRKFVTAPIYFVTGEWIDLSLPVTLKTENGSINGHLPRR